MKKGFTLIELLVVIAIIGILSAVVITSISDSRAKSRDARRITDIRQIQNALGLYYNDNGKFPATLATGIGELAPTYIPSISPNPTGGNYLYASLGTGINCNNYHLGAILERSNPVLNTDNDDAGADGVCTGSNDNFSGADSPNLVYDLKF